MTERISEQLLRQRIRNNIIGYLEMAASAEEQRQFERDVPIACVPNEMINLWEDAVPDTDWEWYSAPVFTTNENTAICLELLSNAPDVFGLQWGFGAGQPARIPRTLGLLEEIELSHGVLLIPD